VHVRALTSEIALMVVRGLRKTREQHGKRQQQDDAPALPRRLKLRTSIGRKRVD
jgi:hypothetical protein